MRFSELFCRKSKCVCVKKRGTESISIVFRISFSLLLLKGQGYKDGHCSL